MAKPFEKIEELPTKAASKLEGMVRPNPGSPEAITQGCTCPRYDNAHGKGYLGGVKDGDGLTVFVRHVTCPLHGVFVGE